MTIESRYFFAIVSANDLIVWHEADQCALPNPHLDLVIRDFSLDLNLLAVHDHYFDAVIVGQGDVFVYKTTQNAENLLAFDLFKEPSDQSDLIRVAVRSSSELVPRVRSNFRAFYDSAGCQVCLEESAISGKVIEMIDAANYPRDMSRSGYRQKLRACLRPAPA
ncbi:MAG: hypothetical protein R3208_16745 [Ketobacteraceae bacterium]|nr:hypothetical protein [Ketobacteraceae bacterium]